MAVPNRPAAGGVVESGWGGVVHDTAVAQDIQTGSATLTHTAANLSNQVTITFPRPFAAPPVVVMVSNNFNYVVAPAGNVATPTAVVIQSKRVDGSAPTGTVVCQWIAYGPRA